MRNGLVGRGRMPAVSVALFLAATLVGCSKTDNAAPATSSPATSTTATTMAPATSAPATVAPTTTVAVKPGNVLIKDYAFAPETQTVTAGQTVTWTNQDDFPHYVITDAGTALDSGDIDPGKTYTATLPTRGTYAYHCNIHNTMKGTILVT
jgi:plastocyanin